MPKRKEQKFKNGHPVRKSEYAPERECYMDEQGNYAYKQWAQQGNGRWELVTTSVARIGENGITAEITIALDDLDCEEDRRNNRIRKLRDKEFEERVSAFQQNMEEHPERAGFDPWERLAWQAGQGKDLLDQIFPEEKPVDPRMEKLLELLDTLTEEQRDLIYAHLGQDKYFEEIAAEQAVRKGTHVSRPAVSRQWDRILNRLCKGFGVDKSEQHKPL